MRESTFQKWVVAKAKEHGWRCWHVPTPMKPIGRNTFVPTKTGAGLPDLVLLHDDPPRLIFAECKNEDGKLSDEQKEFFRLGRAVTDIYELGSEGGEGRRNKVVGVYIWRPGSEGIIETILRSKVLA